MIWRRYHPTGRLHAYRSSISLTSLCNRADSIGSSGALFIPEEHDEPECRTCWMIVRKKLAREEWIARHHKEDL